MLRPRLEGKLFRFLGHEKSIMRAIPASVLWVGPRIVLKPAKTHEPANRRQVSPWWMNDVEHFL